MARSFFFECSRCRYRVVLSGGADRGAHAFTQTVLCRDCRELFDVPVRLRVAPVEFKLRQRLNRRQPPMPPPELDPPPSGWNLRLASAPGLVRWANVKLRCPKQGWHRIQPWNRPGPCPRCGNPLEGTLTPWRYWE